MADTDFGLTSTGFVIMSEDDINLGIRDDLRAEFGPGIEPGLVQGYLGRLVRIFAERVGSVWELGEAINASQNPNAAGGVSLESVCALTGTTRNVATPSTVTLTLAGTPATLCAEGTRGGTAAGDLFATLEDATITLLTSWAALTAYVVDDRRTNNARCYVCITAGTSAASGGPTTTVDDITDGSVHWRWIGEGTGAIDVDADSVETGPIVGNSGDINIIDTAVGGLQSITNLLDAAPGTAVESDSALRVRRQSELERAGTSTIDAIRVDVLEVLGENATCTVFENVTEVTNSDGMPGHSIEVLVQSDVDDQVVADAILATIGAGIETAGSITKTCVDSAGNSHTIKFSRPTPKLIYVAITVRVQDDVEDDDFPDEPTYPDDGNSQIQNAIIALGDTYAVSKSVYAAPLGARAFNVDGVIDLVSVFVGLTVSPADSKVAIGSRELAVFDTSRVAVTTVSG